MGRTVPFQQLLIALLLAPSAWACVDDGVSTDYCEPTVRPTGTNAFTLGSTSTTSITLKTNGTGDAALVVPNDSIALITETNGNFIGGLTAGTAISITNPSGEGVISTINFASTGVRTTTWGTGSTFGWTFDAGANDPQIQFTSGTPGTFWINQVGNNVDFEVDGQNSPVVLFHASSPNSSIGFGALGSSVAFLTIDPSTRTTSTGYNEITTSSFTLNISSGATVSSQYFMNFAAPGIAGVAGGPVETVTNAATVYINKEPTNAGNVTITNDYSLFVDDGPVRFDRENIGVTSTDGLSLQNNQAATVGAQQFSPRLRLTGQGWKTNATAASQTVDWIQQVVPVQGAANPTSYLDWESQVNAAGYTNRMALTSAGVLGIGVTAPGATRLETQGGTARFGDGTNYAQVDGTGILTFAGTGVYQVANDAFAFQAASFTSGGLKFASSAPAGYQFLSTTGVVRALFKATNTTTQDGFIEHDMCIGCDTTVSTLGKFAVLGHVQTQGTAPTVANNDCGTTVQGTVNATATDTAGQITVGTLLVTSCAITFNGTYTNAPACVVTDSGTTFTVGATTSATKLTVTSSASFSGSTIAYYCIGME